MLLEGRDLLLSATKILRPHQRERAIRLARASSRAITGYVAGNLAISVIAGLAVFVFLTIVGVPFAGVLALWVAFADLIPLIGATLGAIPTILVALLQSTTAGLATLVFFLIYQQFENQVLQTTIMSRTVRLKPVIVLASVLIGVELFGLLGALLAIPFAGIVKVIGADVIASRRPDIAVPAKG
jgi:predicted PurR-regulated permease PerM